ncbi:FecR family protein [Prolixibacteraceae bacterium JC049]|nr:FecR family protein [Prolixibacteraceae bacterium JC049]
MDRQNNSLDRYWANKHSLEDKLEVDALFSSKSKDHELKQQLHQLWKNEDGSSREQQPNHNRILLKLHQRIHASQQSTTRNRVLHFYYRIAAVLLLPLMIYTLWPKEQTQEQFAAAAPVEITSPKGVKTKFYLPDGTSGWLNAESKIVFHQNDPNKRLVNLTGEAFFDVAKNKERPFILHLSHFNIKVLGTRFDASNYPYNEREFVVLEEGAVQVLTKSNKEVSELKPSQRFTYLKSSNKYHIEEVKVENYTAWMNGVLTFNHDPLADMAQKLEAYYNIDVEIHAKGLNDVLFFGTLKNESLENVLHFLEITAPIKTKIIDRRNTTNGIYLKRKVVISKK